MGAATSYNFKIGYCIVVLIFSVAGFGSALGQTISSTTPTTAANGTSLTINGNGFGTKASPAPRVFDDFENGANGSVVSTAAGWDAVFSVVADERPQYDSSKSHSGANSSKHSFEDGWNSSFEVFDDFETIYIDGWVNYGQPAGPFYTRVVKLFIVGKSSFGTYPETHFGSSSWPGEQNSVFHLDGYRHPSGATTSPDLYPFSMNSIISGFHHLQVEMKMSDEGVANGYSRIWLDGVLKGEASTINHRTTGDSPWNKLALGYYMAGNSGGDDPALDGPIPDAWMWWDDLYIDTTFARVELGNAPVYENCTYRETQIATGWSSDQISIDFRQGNFQPGDDAWLFVVDGAGAMSAGRQITISGDVVEQGPGQPGQPALIN